MCDFKISEIIKVFEILANNFAIETAEVFKMQLS